MSTTDDIDLSVTYTYKNLKKNHLNWAVKYHWHTLNISKTIIPLFTLYSLFLRIRLITTIYSKTIKLGLALTSQSVTYILWLYLRQTEKNVFLSAISCLHTTQKPAWQGWQRLLLSTSETWSSLSGGQALTWTVSITPRFCPRSIQSSRAPLLSDDSD